MNNNLSSGLLTSESLYEEDFVDWAEKTAQSLREGDFAAVDLEHLIEEVQDLAGRDWGELRSNMLILLTHLLKWQYQPERRSYPGSANDWNENNWARTISEHRDRIQESLQESPSLNKVLMDSMGDRYQKARKAASKQTFWDLHLFPQICPYSIAEMLDDDFWLEK